VPIACAHNGTMSHGRAEKSGGSSLLVFAQFASHHSLYSLNVPLIGSRRKGKFGTFTEAELDAIEAEANKSIDLKKLVPVSAVDAVYFESAYYPGPG
jgi:hypothetical protein